MQQPISHLRPANAPAPLPDALDTDQLDHDENLARTPADLCRTDAWLIGLLAAGTMVVAAAAWALFV